MEFEVVVEHCPDDSYFGYSEKLDGVMATGKSKNEVLEQLRNQIHYQLEYCPCSFIKPERLKLEVIEREGICSRK